MRRRAFIALLGGISSVAVIRRARAAPPAAIADGTPIGRGKRLVVQEDASGRIIALESSSTWNDGIISVVNAPAAARGVKICMGAKAAARLMLVGG